MSVLRSTLCIAVGGPVLAWHALRLAAQLAGGLLGLLLAGCHVAGERALFGKETDQQNEKVPEIMPVERARAELAYCIENPSAWENFDQSVSDKIAAYLELARESQP